MWQKSILTIVIQLLFVVLILYYKFTLTTDIKYLTK